MRSLVSRERLGPPNAIAGGRPNPTPVFGQCLGARHVGALAPSDRDATRAARVPAARYRTHDKQVDP
jgi:hypothetical protein